MLKLSIICFMDGQIMASDFRAVGRDHGFGFIYGWQTNSMHIKCAKLNKFLHHKRALSQYLAK